MNVGLQQSPTQPMRPGKPQVTSRNRAEGRRARTARSTFMLNGLALCVPLAMAHQVEIIGRLYAAEFILLLALPLLMLDRGRMLLDTLPKTILCLAGAWLASQIVTDLVDATPYADYSRGWAKIVFFTLNFAAIYMLVYGNRQRLILFAIGVAIGVAISNYRYPTENFDKDPWKFAYGMSVSLAIVAVAQARFIQRVPIMPILIMFGVGGLNLAFGWRSMAGVCFLAGLYLVAQLAFGKKGERVTPPTTTRLVLIAIVALTAILAVLELYGFAALEGYLGEDARLKYLDQTEQGLGILLGGRQEIFVSLQAILDSPFLGHGSWAKDPKYIDMLISMTRGENLQLQAYTYYGLIPTHSHLTGAWVEAGIVGGMFWLFVLFLVARVMANLFQVRETLSMLAVFVAILMTWDVLFSPFGADRRVVVAYQIVMMIFMWDIVKGHAARARQIRRIRRAAKHALGAVRPGHGPHRPIPNLRLMRRPPANVATLPRPSARTALRTKPSSDI